MIRLLDTLVGRTILVSLIGISVMHMLSLWSYEAALDHESVLQQEARLADRLVAIKRTLALAPEAGRDEIAHELSGGPLEVHWSRDRKAAPGGLGFEQWLKLPERLLGLVPELRPEDIIIGSAGQEGDPHVALISIRLPDASWANVGLFAYGPRRAAGHETLLSTSVMALGVVLVSVIVAGWLTRPLRSVADAVRALRPGSNSLAIAETGPREVRDLAAAFNDMQRRIANLIDERTRALAAVSHDLRTPLTRLKFRMEDLGDGEMRMAMERDIAEVEQMIEATLSYLSGEGKDELARPLDLAILLETLANDAADLGRDVSLKAPRGIVIRARHIGLKRAFSNLIDNAVTYGGGARVTVQAAASNVTVYIDDDGPGIPADRLASVLEPFVRLEASRNRETGGVGLGLTIARANIEADGGTLTLVNREEGGLRVTVILPRKAA
jgi:two-component system, OmpR family, sensor kinase